jgi:hypothetical protein
MVDSGGANLPRQVTTGLKKATFPAWKKHSTSGMQSTSIHFRHGKKTFPLPAWNRKGWLLCIPMGAEPRSSSGSL